MKKKARHSTHVSLALRIAVASAVFGLLVAGGAVVVGFWTLSRQLDERADMEMKGRKELLAHVLSSVPSLASVGAAEERFSELFFGHDNLHLALLDPSTGRVLAAFTEVASHSVIAIGHATARASRSRAHSGEPPSRCRSRPPCGSRPAGRCPIQPEKSHWRPPACAAPAGEAAMLNFVPWSASG